MSGAVQQLLTTNPEVLTARAAYQGSEAQLDAAWGGYLPSLELNYATGTESTDSPSTRLSSADPVELDRSEAGVVLRQALFDGTKFNAVDSAEALREANRHALESTRDKVLYKGVERFLEVVRNRRIFETAKSSLAAHEKILEKVRKRSQGGAGSRADTQQAESRVALARVNFLQYQSSLEQSEYAYQAVFGVLPESELIDDIELGALEINDRDQAVSEALREHPLLRKSQSELEAAREEQAVAQGRYYPNVYLEARVNSNENLDGVEGVHDDTSIMLRLNYNLFNGGSDRARSRARAEKVNQALQQLETSRRGITEKVQQAWSNRQIATEKADYLSTQLDRTVSVRDAYQKQFNLGKRSLLDVLEVEQELHQAQRDKIKAEHEVRLAEFGLRYAMGRLKAAVVRAE